MRYSLASLLVTVTVAYGWTSADVGGFKPVTERMLEGPDPADWLHWRRTLNGWGYSPLDQLNAQNVGRLELVWSRTLTPGVGETTPLVYNGVMYISKPM